MAILPLPRPERITLRSERQTAECPGYTYDGSVWTLTITVTDVDSVLTITDENVTYRKTVAGESTESHESAAFTNRYDTTATGYTPWVNKVLTGEPTPTDKTFNFTLEAKTDYGTDAVIAENGDSTSVTGAGRGKLRRDYLQQAGVPTNLPSRRQRAVTPDIPMMEASGH